MPKTKTKKNIGDFKEIKKDLVEDLDQFLLDSDVDIDTRQAEKNKALAELDKLIKQDLSYSQILTSLKKDSAKNIKEQQEENKAVELPQAEEAIFLSSQSRHIIDLRNQNKKVAKKKAAKSFKIKLPKFEKRNKAEKVEKKQESLAQDKKIPSVFNWANLSTSFSKALIFALILGVILMPIRALVIWGDVRDDKSKIINFGQEGLLSLQSGVLSASENSYQDAQADFDKALESFDKAQLVLNGYNQWILNTVSVLPLVGKPVSLSRNMLSVASNISNAASVLNKKVQEQTRPTEYLDFIGSQITETLPYLEKANQDIQGISTNLLPQEYREYFDNLKIYLPATIENLQDLDTMFKSIATLLGHQSEKRYIVLFQNNNELRPTGGFIGSFAIFDVYKGQVVSLDIPGGGLYDLDAGQSVKFKSPEALALINPTFNIWDANWWYDFPSSAKKIIWFYQQAADSSVDGVIAINAQVLKELLEVLGPVEMSDYGIVINSENIFDVLQEEVELNYDKEENQPKAVIADLVPIVLERLLSYTDKQKEIVAVFAKSLANKNIQLYAEEEELQKDVVAFGWSGKMADASKDYLAVIATNIAGGKTDNNIYQTIDHQAVINAKGEIINTVKITRENKEDEDNPFAGIYGGNASYLRFYVPAGAEFIEAIGFDTIPDNYFKDAPEAIIDNDIAKEEIKMIDNDSGTEIFSSLNKTVFANWMTLASGESKTALIKYKLPFTLDFKDPLVNDWWKKILKEDLSLDNYSLVVQSQSGMMNNYFNSSILLPDNVKIVYNNALDKSSVNLTEKIFTYSKKLDRDQYFGFILANN